MKTFKKAAFICLSMLLSVLMCGCSLLSTGDELLSAPKAGGEFSKIQSALESAVSGSYTLKYPTAGEFRSAIVRYDLTGNGKEDAIAFYSTESENISQMHIAVLTEKNGEWKAQTDAETLASGIERVEFCDLDGDGLAEILVGWSILGNVDKQISVYSFDGSLLLTRAEDKYSEFVCCDLDTNGKNELLILHLNSTEGTGKARLLEITDSGVNEISSTATDGGVNSYFGIYKSKLLDGKAAVYADGKKGAGSVTEVFFISNGMLQNPLYSAETAEIKTERPYNLAARDLTGDGVLNIPIAKVAPGYEELPETDKEYITYWCSYGNKLVVNEISVVDTADGYYIELPKALDGKITVETSKDGKSRIFSLYNPKKKEKGEVLFKTRETAKTEWREESGWKKVAETETLVISVLISAYDGAEALSLQQIEKMVKVFEKGN